MRFYLKEANSLSPFMMYANFQECFEPREEMGKLESKIKQVPNFSLKQFEK